MNALNVPAEIAYPSLEEAKNALFTHALAEGYGLVVLQTRHVGNKKEGAIKALILNCSKGRHTNRAIQSIAPQRATGSTATGCMFRASIREEAGAWQVYVENGDHNHEAFADQTAHPQGRALSVNQTDMVIRMGRAGVTPSLIGTSLHQNDGVLSTLQNIYNIRAADRITLLAGRTPLVALLDNLAVTTEYYIKRDKHMLTHFMIISLTAKEICEKFSASRVWLTDATYIISNHSVCLLM